MFDYKLVVFFISAFVLFSLTSTFTVSDMETIEEEFAEDEAFSREVFKAVEEFFWKIFFVSSVFYSKFLLEEAFSTATV